jgi:hypothetical protein
VVHLLRQIHCRHNEKINIKTGYDGNISKDSKKKDSTKVTQKDTKDTSIKNISKSNLNKKTDTEIV